MSIVIVIVVVVVVVVNLIISSDYILVHSLRHMQANTNSHTQTTAIADEIYIFFCSFVVSLSKASEHINRHTILFLKQNSSQKSCFLHLEDVYQSNCEISASNMHVLN